ncbi:MAG: hypothetical protein HY815_13120, partial [Candidatus Riflebacteria bacterium]|nr:hypothetical protein [Candidatus Riflebacteria bacterium]
MGLAELTTSPARGPSCRCRVGWSPGRLGTAFLVSAFIALAVARPAPGQSSQRLGRLLWSEVGGGGWSDTAPSIGLATEILYPDGAQVPEELVRQTDRLFRVSPASAPTEPRLHPILDHLGTGYLAGSGRGTQVDQASGSTVKTQGKILARRLVGDNVETPPTVAEATDKGCFFASSSHDGR